MSLGRHAQTYACAAKGPHHVTCRIVPALALFSERYIPALVTMMKAPLRGYRRKKSGYVIGQVSRFVHRKKSTRASHAPKAILGQAGRERQEQSTDKTKQQCKSNSTFPQWSDSVCHKVRSFRPTASRFPAMHLDALTL